MTPEMQHGFIPEYEMVNDDVGDEADDRHWWVCINHRRGLLIDRQIAGTLTPWEELELRCLQAYADVYLEAVAPRPSLALGIHTTPLSRSEQDDLFRQMTKRLSRVGVQPANLLACEMENMYRMRATILQLRESLEWAEKSILAYEQKG